MKILTILLDKDLAWKKCLKTLGNKTVENIALLDKTT